MNFPKLRNRALSDLTKIQGNRGLTLAHHFRAKLNLFDSPKNVVRSLSTKRSNYKSTPMHKLIALPPEYTLGIRKPITPIKGCHDKSLVFKSNAGSLIIPKMSFPMKFTSPTPSPNKPTISLKHAHQIITSRIKILSSRLYPKSITRPIVSSRVFSESPDLRNIKGISESPISLSRIQRKLIKKWDNFFTNI